MLFSEVPTLGFLEEEGEAGGQAGTQMPGLLPAVEEVNMAERGWEPGHPGSFQLWKRGMWFGGAGGPGAWGLSSSSSGTCCLLAGACRIQP